MAKKNTRSRYEDSYKAAIVTRALKARETGKETISAIAAEEELNETTMYAWIKAATTKKETNGQQTNETKKAEEEPKTKLMITGLTPLIKELVVIELRAQLPGIVAAEINKAFSKK